MTGGSIGAARRPMTVAAAALALLVALAILPTRSPAASSPEPFSAVGERIVDIIVRAEEHALVAARQRILESGGSIGFELPIIGGFSATTTGVDAAHLSRMAGVTSVSIDHEIALSSAGGQGSTALARTFDDVLDVDAFWRKGFEGDGIGVALIDSGIAPVAGLSDPTKILDGPDLSFDSTDESSLGYDSFGHGTHLAGIIAGRDPGLTTKDRLRGVGFSGIAPGAHLVDVKVADGAGSADVSQVIAGIQWVVDQATGTNAANIRVLALAFGTDGTQDYRIDPLAYAVEQAWHAGLVVVVAAGNDGIDEPLRNPASDPFVISVGAVDDNSTPGRGDDRVLSLSNCGTSSRSVDVLAPGKSLASLRVPGSMIDENFSSARVGDRFFKGTGTSQATAVVAGVAALLLDQRPELTPDQVKSILTEASHTVPQAPGACSAAGLISPSDVMKASTPSTVQTYAMSDGSGSLELARGSYHVALDGEPIVGEIDVTGQPWSGGTWSGGTWSGGTWSGGTWSGGTWSGGTWSGGTWSGGTWSGGTWSGGTWSGGTWSGGTWSGGTWSGGTWSGGTWSGGTWSVGSWS